MDREQQKVLQGFGYVFSEVPNLRQQQRATFYRLVDGEVMECPNLPADPLSLQRYLAKGFRLNKEELKPQTVEKSQEGFTCEVCGRKFKARIGLISHSRKHK